MKTGYLTVTRYTDPSVSPRVRFWITKQEAERYKYAFLLTEDMSVEILGPIEINPEWINSNGLISVANFESINIGPQPNEKGL